MQFWQKFDLLINLRKMLGHSANQLRFRAIMNIFNHCRFCNISTIHGRVNRIISGKFSVLKFIIKKPSYDKATFEILIGRAFCLTQRGYKISCLKLLLKLLDIITVGTFQGILRKQEVYLINIKQSKTKRLPIKHQHLSLYFFMIKI